MAAALWLWHGLPDDSQRQGHCPAHVSGHDQVTPYAALIQATDGNFYGTTSSGGPSNSGTIFTITPSGDFAGPAHFSGSTDGAAPHAPLIQATDGNFYGTTSSGGASNLGTVFRMAPSGTVTVLHAFTGGSDGASRDRCPD